MMTLDQKLDQAVADVRQLVEDLDVPPFEKPRTSWVLALAAALVVVVLMGGLGWWLTAQGDDTPPVITQPDVTTTTVPLPSQELTMEKLNNQGGFLRSVAKIGGGCGEDLEGGPFVCETSIDSPLLTEPFEVEYTVEAIFDQVLQPDDFEWESKVGAAARESLEPELAGLYTWALATYPDETETECRVDFQGDDSVLAWEPGYAANEQCGVYLGGLINEYRPVPDELPPAPGLGRWYRVPGQLPDAEFNSLFDVAETPFGLLATGTDGLWISEDGVTWEPFARDAVVFPEAGPFARLASSELGTLCAYGVRPS